MESLMDEQNNAASYKLQKGLKIDGDDSKYI